MEKTFVFRGNFCGDVTFDKEYLFHPEDFPSGDFVLSEEVDVCDLDNDNSFYAEYSFTATVSGNTVQECLDSFKKELLSCDFGSLRISSRGGDWDIYEIIEGEEESIDFEQYKFEFSYDEMLNSPSNSSKEPIERD